LHVSELRKPFSVGDNDEILFSINKIN